MLFTLPLATEVQVSLEAGDSAILTTGKVVTRDPNVGNGIEFTTMPIKIAKDFASSSRMHNKRKTSPRKIHVRSILLVLLHPLPGGVRLLAASR